MLTPPAVPTSPLQSCLPCRSWLQGLAECLAAWHCEQKGGCYLAVVQLDTCLLHGTQQPHTMFAEQWHDASALLSPACCFRVPWTAGITQ